jgi:hypothetical protein
MTVMTTNQSHLREYACAILRHHGVKTCHATWIDAHTLKLTVQPYGLDKARRALPVIQQRADKFEEMRVVIDTDA